MRAQFVKLQNPNTHLPYVANNNEQIRLERSNKYNLGTIYYNHFNLLRIIK